VNIKLAAMAMGPDVEEVSLSVLEGQFEWLEYLTPLFHVFS